MPTKYLPTLLLTLAPIMVAFAGEPEPLNFSRDIRPILSAKCFACHGPDSQDRDADYRLDTREGAFADLGGYAAIVPGQPDKSELIARITSHDEDDLMPPPEQKDPLSTKEIQLLTRWEVSHFGHPTFFSAQHFFPDRGQQVYRRSLYTFWKRTSPPPVMPTFDAPNRETCTVRRGKTNTPLQALALCASADVRCIAVHPVDRTLRSRR
ncbi:DUF1553 domain-containing protein [bacterium]|nr:DUF1553 domain-containing protein [bacterium]